MTKKSKKFVKISIVILLILLFNGILFCVHELLFGPTVSSKKNEFLPLVKEYTKISEFYYNDFKKYDKDILIYSVPDSNNKNDRNIVCFSNNNREIQITEEIYNCFFSILSSYYLDKQSLDHIIVYDKFISFCNNNGRSSYVYSMMMLNLNILVNQFPKMKRYM